jgi:hypothetical protein
MKLPRVRFTIGRMMVAVAISAIFMAGLLQFARRKQLIEQYEGRVINARRLVSRARLTANLSHEEWLAHCREIDRLDRANPPFRTARGYPPELAKELIAYGESIRRKYDRAIRYPWLPVLPDPSDPRNQQ